MGEREGETDSRVRSEISKGHCWQQGLELWWQPSGGGQGEVERDDKITDSGS